MEQLPDYYVYTDGACSNNGKPNARAGIGIYFGVDDPRNVSTKVEGRQTNNVAELSAIIETYSIIEKDILEGKYIVIMSDSVYAIRCVTSYGEKCDKTGWKDIPNKELVQIAYKLYTDKPNIRFQHVAAHTNGTDVHSIGNDYADKLANKAIGVESSSNNKIYLNVPFSKKEEIKQLGGRWDASKKKWFIHDTNRQKDYILSIFTAY